MKKPTIILLLMVLCCSFLQVNAQKCQTDENHERLVELDPKYELKRQKIEAFTQNYITNQNSATERSSAAVITIPVVFHVVYANATENVSDARIMSQLQILNEDFRRTNPDAGDTRPAFIGDAADTEIEFCLATVDPNGAPTTGIVRQSTTVSSFSASDNMKFNSSGGSDAWPSGTYLNFWVCDLGSGLLGYAQFPGGSAATDGVVCDYNTLPGGPAPYGDGRTGTHEVGHWVNLYHTFQGGCSGSGDFCADTPPVSSPTYGCPGNKTSCGTQTQFENYMDYSDDDCMNMFSEDQKTRAQAIFAPGGARFSMVTAAGIVCGAPPAPTCTDGIQNGLETGIDCGGPDCPACPPCDDVTLAIILDNYPEETSWEITDASGAVVASGGTYGSEPDGSTVTETVCLTTGCYDLTLFDSFGDGICCAYGIGSYTLTDASGTVLVNSNGDFGSSETTNFCVTSAPACPIPTNLGIIINSPTSGIATWDAMPGAVNYNLLGRKIPGSFQSFNASTNQKAYNSFGAGKTYEFQVRTNCGGGLLSDYSGLFQFTMPTSKSGLAQVLSVYPNPATDALTVNFDAGDARQIELTITDMLGRVVTSEQVVLEGQLYSNTFDLSQFDNGIYFLNIIAEGNKMQQQFSIAR